METEYEPKPGRKVILTLSLVGVILAAALAGEFIFKLQPGLGGGGTIVAGSVIMPPEVGKNTLLNFEPATITVIIGLNNTVTFKNEDNSAPAHTVTARDGSFNSGDIKPGDSWTHTFSTPGNFSYYCVYHSWMTGKVIVKAAGAGGPTIKIPSGTAANQLNYSPSRFTVIVGVNNTVTFVNQDSATHTVTALDGSFNSGDILGGHSWTHTFTTPGTYAFHCIYHGFMTGQVTVIAGS